MGKLNVKLVTSILVIVVVTLIVTVAQNTIHNRSVEENMKEVYVLRNNVIKHELIDIDDVRVVRVDSNMDGGLIDLKGYYSNDLMKGKILDEADIQYSINHVDHKVTMISVRSDYQKLLKIKRGQEVLLFHSDNGEVEEIGTVKVVEIGEETQSMLGGNSDINWIVTASSKVMERLIPNALKGSFIVVLNN